MREQKVVVLPSRHLRDGQTVAVRATGFTPGEALQVVQCADRGTATGPSDCNLAAMQSAVSSARGTVAARLAVVRGPFGSSGVVCSATVRCLISVTQASLTPTEQANAPISFGPAGS
ncbi:hypothetical protein GCM10027265_11250 [Jatrophihabitans fulvus]